MGCAQSNNTIIPLSEENILKTPDKKIDGTLTSRNTGSSETRTTETDDSLNLRVPSSPTSPRTSPRSSPRTTRLNHNEFMLLVKNNSITSANAFFYVNKNPQCLFVTDKDGKTVMDYAVANGNTNLVNLFKKKQMQCSSFLVPAV